MEEDCIPRSKNAVHYSRRGSGTNPEEEGVEHAHAELQRSDGQGKPGRAAGGLERHLVADVVCLGARVGDQKSLSQTLLLVSCRQILQFRAETLNPVYGRNQKP